MLLINRSKKEQIDAKFENTFPFLKTLTFTIINFIRYQLKPLKCSFISTQEAIETMSLSNIRLRKISKPMKLSRSNCSYKAGKQMFEGKTNIKIKL